jgi:hypothetical protein
MHLSDDTLLQCCLNLLEPVEVRLADEHIKVCDSCRKRYEVIQAETLLLGTVRGDAPAPPLPARSYSSVFMRTLLRAAALLLLGFLTGFGTSRWTTREPINVVPSYLLTQPPADSVAAIAAEDATEYRKF